MKTKLLVIAILICALCLGAGTTVWGAKGGIPGKPTKDEPEDPPATPIEGYYFWRLGHMDGPHDSSKALGISRDGETAVGSTQVVDFTRAWRLDIDWAIATDDGVPPLYNELQVQEDIGIVAPSVPSAAYASSDMTWDSDYDKLALQLDWGGSKPVGTIMQGTVSQAIEWLLPVLDSVDEGDFIMIPDFGGGASEMVALDVSADGLIMVGNGNTKTGPAAFRADMTDPLLPVVQTLTVQDAVSLQTLQGTVAEAVSADGTIIAGYGGTSRGNKAFVATVLDATTDPITLESYILPAIDGGQWSEAYAMTTVTNEADGTPTIYIAGRSDSPKGPQACIWFCGDDDPNTPETETWVVKPLGGLSKKKLDSVATSIVHRPGSPVGELMVVGRSQSILYPSEAFVWTGNPVLEPDGENDEFIGYMYDLEYILIKTGAGEASLMGSSWILNEATGVSFGEDGTRIVGWGTNPEGGIEAWLVTNYPFDELDLTHE